MNFSKIRFVNFAKYDLTINKAFFRNMALVTLAGTIGIAMLGFITRYNIYQDVVDRTSEWSTPPVPGDFTHYTWNYITTLYELGFIDLMLLIFAGCWAHNLRNKQGRITELTLPATNLEKFTWHSLLMLVGGFLLCLVSLLLADGFNALLTLLMFGAQEGIGSLTWSAGECVTFTTSANEYFGMPSVNVNGDVSQFSISEHNLLYASSFLLITSTICVTFIFFFGNALKYKYNIILTYIALQIISTIGSIAFFIISAISADNAIEAMGDADLEGNDVANFFAITFVVIGCIELLLSAALMWWSYRRYTRAQITSAFNK